MCSMEKMFGLEMFAISHVNGDGNIFDFYIRIKYGVLTWMKFMGTVLSVTFCTKCGIFFIVESSWHIIITFQYFYVDVKWYFFGYKEDNSFIKGFHWTVAMK